MALKLKAHNRLALRSRIAIVSRRVPPLLLRGERTATYRKRFWKA